MENIYKLNIIFKIKYLFLMIFKLDFKEEKDIPYYFKCIICRKVPKHSMVDY